MVGRGDSQETLQQYLEERKDRKKYREKKACFHKIKGLLRRGRLVADYFPCNPKFKVENNELVSKSDFLICVPLTFSLTNAFSSCRDGS